MIYKMVIRVKADECIGRNLMKRYIRQAVSSWGKGGDPEKPLFDIELVSISTIKKEIEK